MPKNLQEWRACCVEHMNCPSRMDSLTASDDECEDGLPDGATEGEAEGEFQLDVMECVDGLMEFAAQAGGDDTIQECDM